MVVFLNFKTNVIGILIRFEGDFICMSKGSSINILFSDSSRLSLINENASNYRRVEKDKETMI